MKHETINRKATAKAQQVIKKGSQKTAVTAAKFLEKKANFSKKKVKPVVPAQNVKSQVKKNKSNKTVQALKPELKKVEVAAPFKTTKSKTVSATKTKIKNLKPVSAVSKIEAAAKKAKPSKVVVKTIKPKTKVKPVSVVAQKSKARKLKPNTLPEKIKPVEKKKLSPIAAQEVKKPNNAKIKLTVTEKTTKSKVQKPEANVSNKKAKTVGEKNKQNVITQKQKLQTKNNESAKSIQADRSKPRKIKPVILDEKISAKKPNANSVKSSKKSLVGKIKSEGKQIKLAALVETVKTKKAKPIKAKAQKIEPIVPVKKVKAVENKINPTILALEKKLKKKKNKPIGAAVFRGRKDRYDFKVFPLDNDFEDVSAIYIISRRKIDRQKKGHHALVCIGQTDSVSGEIKRHKLKCIKRHNANVISVLPEADAKKRLKIEEDLKSAHAIACNVG
jgi:hypothetical protein